MFGLARAGVLARRVATSVACTRPSVRNMASFQQEMTKNAKIIGGVIVGGAASLFAFDGLSHKHNVAPMTPPPEPEEEMVATPTITSSGSIVIGDLRVSTANIESPSYDNLDVQIGENVVLKWNQNGSDVYQVFNFSGECLAGPGPLVEPTVEVVEEKPAAVAEVIAEYIPTPAAPSTDDSKLLEAIAQIEARLSAIESSLPGYGPSVSIDGYPRFPEKCSSLLKKHLSNEVYLECAGRITPSGFTLENVMQSGVDNFDSGVGCYAGDEESYTVFAPLFDRVIEDYHNGYKPTDKHVSDMDASKLHGSVDPDYVISTRIRVGRNIRGLGLSPGISRAQRRVSESILVDALSKVDGDLEGKYYSLGNMSEEDRKQLVADHFLFKKGDRFLQSAGANRDWPESRGIFHNNEKTFLVWVNEEDQARIISMEQGGDVKGIFERLSRGIAAIEKGVQASGYEYAYNDHLGYIHSCPTNCGTGMRASVHVKLPNVSKHPDFKNWCEKLRLQPRGIHGEHSESEGGVYDISNKERLGKSEVQLVQTMIDGVTVLIDAEKSLESKGTIPLPSKLLQ
eukprot:m.27106 g.27106  ORF g.27106 m.27106 type:complete len:568 (-) comp5913_c0_seq1:103-1806(-)